MMMMTVTLLMSFMFPLEFLSSAQAMSAHSINALRQLGPSEGDNRPVDRNVDSVPGGGQDGLPVVYMPGYVIPVGAPVDPCVSCRPRRTTSWCRKKATGRCSQSTKRCCSTTPKMAVQRNRKNIH